MRCLPNMTVMAPADENECRQMLYTAFTLDGRRPCVTRAAQARVSRRSPTMTALPVGKGELRRRGRRVAVLVFGVLLAPALEVAEKLDLTVVNMRFVKPLDEAMVLEMARSHELLVTFEENVVAGGAGSAVNECLAAHGESVSIANCGLPDRLIQHGSREEMLTDAGLDAAGFEQFVRARIAMLDAQAPAVRRA
jgi:1-deoxy-D-xylulose-5-phosphate synthase